jgi:lipoic acid synthetase
VEIDGERVYANLAELPEVPEALSVITPPAVTRQIMAEAIAAPIPEPSGNLMGSPEVSAPRGESALVEALTGDFQAKDEQIQAVLDGGPDVFAHNVETVLRLTPRVRDAKCSYVRSLAVLRRAKELSPGVVTKSSIMLGLGESEREVDQAMDDLREHGVDVVTFGQYLRPTLKHLPVREHITPARFKAFEQRALRKGFLYVASGPLVRSSYKAAEFYIEGMLRRRRAGEDVR